MKSSVYEIVTNSIISKLEKGVVPWRKPWRGGEALACNALTRRTYRGINLLLLSLSPFADHRWLTFKQVQERGGKVKAGERSTLVVFWKQADKPKPSEDEPKVRKPPILRYFNVFNLEQCEDLGLPAEYAPEEGPRERIARADSLVSSMPNAPRICEGQSAWYRPSDDLVQVPPIERFQTADAYYATLFHELGHATGHESRLNRLGVTGNHVFGSGGYSQEELVAELTSAFCCGIAELDNSLLDSAASYVEGWLKVLRADSKALVMAAAQAQKAADYIRGVQYSL